MVELKNVSVTYSSGVDALNNVSLKINDGDFAFVVGSSGAGKSTMIKLLLKEIDATSGSVIVNGYNLNKLRKKKIPKFRRTLGFVFQDFRLIPSMTVYENIAFVLRVIDAPTKFIKKRVPYVINLVGLHDKLNSYPDELSGGEKQRVAIARALVNDPQLIIADEPTGNIDPELSYEIVELLKGINDQGTTILMVTHEHDLVRHFGGRIINIKNGEIEFDEIITGTQDEVPEVKEVSEVPAGPVDDLAPEFPAEQMAEAIIESEKAAVSAVPSIDEMTADDIINKINEDTQAAAEEAANPLEKTAEMLGRLDAEAAENVKTENAENTVSAPDDEEYADESADVEVSGDEDNSDEGGADE